MHMKYIYGPMLHSVREPFSVPIARSPFCSKKYVLQETPYLKNLIMAPEQAQDRPVTYHNKLLHL
jgi:hypothetical protein